MYAGRARLWRLRGGDGRQIVYSQLIGVLSCAAVAYLCMPPNGFDLAASLTVAVMAWLAGPVVVIAQMVLWTKLHPLLGVSQSVGWLVRFLLTGALGDYIGHWR